LSVKHAELDIPNLEKGSPSLGTQLNDDDHRRKVSFADKRRRDYGKSDFPAKPVDKAKVNSGDDEEDIDRAPSPKVQFRSSQGFAQRRRTNQAASNVGFDLEKKRSILRSKLQPRKDETVEKIVNDEAAEDSNEILEHRIMIAPDAGNDEKGEGDKAQEEIELARQARAKHSAAMTSDESGGEASFCATLIDAMRHNFFCSLLSEVWTEFWSMRSQARRTLRAELDGVILPPHWKELSLQGLT
jgi:hypothetical protein